MVIVHVEYSVPLHGMLEAGQWLDAHSHKRLQLQTQNVVAPYNSIYFGVI